MITALRAGRVSRVLQVVILLGAMPVAPLQSQGDFSLARSIPLPGVEGRIDHMAIDLPGNRLFVAALGNNSLETIDLSSDSVVHRIHGLSEPQGVAYIEDSHKLYVANAGTGECDVYDGRTYALLRQIDVGGDADNLHPDAASHRLLVSAGNSLTFIDTTADARAGRLELPGHPEGFALEQNGPRVFVNVPQPGGRVFVVDRDRGILAAEWQVGGLFKNLFSNFPISLDEDNQRLFVGTRVPARLKVLNAVSGKVVADIGIDGDSDDIFYDAKRRKAYVSCGAGYLDVVVQLTPDRYAAPVRIPTARGARTSLWVPERDRLFVAVPHDGNQRAEVRIYEPSMP